MMWVWGETQPQFRKACDLLLQHRLYGILEVYCPDQVTFDTFGSIHRYLSHAPQSVL